MVFDEVLLEPEQKELLVKLVEAARNVRKADRHKFLWNKGPIRHRGYILHPGLPTGRCEAYFGDVEMFAREGFLHLSRDDVGRPTFDVSPRSFAYYREMKLGTEPIQQVQTEVRSYLDAQLFRERYPVAYQKWADAEANLWGSDSQRELTTIGHLCREAMQAFGTALVERYQPSDVDQDKTHDIKRVRTVLAHLRGQASEKVEKLLDALSVYWETVSGLVQRQEHGAQKEGEPLVWEDARRLVFQTAVVMFEIDQSLSSLR